MASTSITFNKLQPQELFTFSICKHFSISFNYNSIISLSSFTPLNTSSTTSTTLFAGLTNPSRTTLTQTIIDVNNISCSVTESSSLDISSLGSVKQRVKKEKLVKGFVNNGKFSERNYFSNREMENSAKNSSGYDEDVLNFDGTKQKYSRGKNVISGDVSREPIKRNDHSNGFGKKDLNFDGTKQKYSRGKNVISGDVSGEPIKRNDHSNGFGKKDLNFDGTKQKYSRGKNVISGDVSREPIKRNDHSNGFGKKDLNFDGKKHRYSRGKNVISGEVSGELIKGIDHSNRNGKKDVNFDGKKQRYSRGKNVISGDVSGEPIKVNDHSNGYDGRKLGNYRGRNVISGDVSSESIDRNDHSNGYGRKASNFDGTCKENSWSSSNRGKNVISGANVTNGGVSGKPIKEDDQSSEMKVKKREKSSKKNKGESSEFKSRIGLDKCSKMGDIMGAISLYDSAVNNNVKMGPYHYTVLLYLCSSAAMGVIQPAKSGSMKKDNDNVACQTSNDSNEHEEEEEDDDGDIDNDGLDKKDQTRNLEAVEIRVSDDVKKLALKKGFEIYERMRSEKVKMNEATLTSMARMAMAMGDGEMAFEMVNQMKSMGVNPKLRSYIPSLLTFSNNGDVEKAFEVEKHMLENGVHPEEPELEALLRVSVRTGKADRVYYLLHKLRTTVRVVSPSTADVIEEWFKRKDAARVGKRKWDPETMVNVGGGWHGKGWLGKGKWVVSQTNVGNDGVCKCCGEKLALIDLDDEETDRFAESVASIAVKRERDSDFQKFQKWLDYHGPFEAVVDAANVGLFSYKKFKPSKVNVIVNGIRQVLPSRNWPLIVLHNRRLAKSKMDKPVDRALVDRWINADALYATPTGSNDDWYWLYAAIKFKALLVTNDEMRDHIFQLLGNDFFPKWKERHQVRFSFSEMGPVFHMPPPCSVVIQESKWGHWHIPIASDHQFERDRIWLCVSRLKSLVNKLKPEDGLNIVKGEEPKGENEHKASKTSPELQDKAQSIVQPKRKSKEPVFEHTKDLKTTPPKSSSSNILHTSIWDTIDAAEKLSGNTIDFQI